VDGFYKHLQDTRGLPNAAQVIQDISNCGLGCGLEICLKHASGTVAGVAIAEPSLNPGHFILTSHPTETSSRPVGKVFDLTLPLDVAEGYRAMDERRAIQPLIPNNDSADKSSTPPTPTNLRISRNSVFACAHCFSPRARKAAWFRVIPLTDGSACRCTSFTYCVLLNRRTG
jgi:hypothetical protein